MKSGGDDHDDYFRAFQNTTRLESAQRRSIQTNHVTVSRLVSVPKRSLFVAACLDFVLRVYEYAGSTPFVLSGGHRGAVMDVVHLHDDVIASVALDGSICTWRIGNTTAKKSSKSPQSPKSARTTPASSSQGLVDSLRLENESAMSIASLNSNHIVVGTESGKLIILKHKARGEALHVVKTMSHRDSVLRIAAMENDYFVSVSRDKTARVWNTTNIATLHKPIAALSFDSSVVSVAMNHEHHLIALGTATGALHVYYISDVNSVEKVFHLVDVDFCLNSIRFVTNDILAIACLSGCVVFVSISAQRVVGRIALDRSTFLMDTAPLGDGHLVAVGMRNFSAVFQIPAYVFEGKAVEGIFTGNKKYLPSSEKETLIADDNSSMRSSAKVDPVRSSSSKRGMRIKGGPVVKSGSSKKGIRIRNSSGGTADAAAATAGGDEANETLVLRKGASNTSLSAMAGEARRAVAADDGHVLRKGSTTASNNSLSAMAEEARRANGKEQGKSNNIDVAVGTSKKGIRKGGTRTVDGEPKKKAKSKSKREESAVVRPSLSNKIGLRRRKARAAKEEETQVSSSGSKKGIRRGRSATNISMSDPVENDSRSHSTLGHSDDIAKVKASLRPASQQPASAGSKKGIRVRGSGSNRGIAIPTSPVSGKLEAPSAFAKEKKKDSPSSIPLPSSLFGNQSVRPSTIIANQKLAAVAKVTPPASKTPQPSTQAPSQPPPASPSVGVMNKSLPLPPPVLPLPSQPVPAKPSLPLSNTSKPVPAKSASTPPPPPPGFGSRLIPPPLTKGRSPPPPPPPVAVNGNVNRAGIRPKSTPLTPGPPAPPPVTGHRNAGRPNSTPLTARPPAPPTPPPVVSNNSKRPKSSPLPPPSPPPVSASKPVLSPPISGQSLPPKRRAPVVPVIPVVETPAFMMSSPCERATMTANYNKKISRDPTNEDNRMSLPIIQIFNAEDENESDATSVWDENRRNAEPPQKSSSSHASRNSGGTKEKLSFESLLDKFNNSFNRRRNTDLNVRR